MSFSRAVLGLQLLVLIVLMVLRTTPVRVTPNPWFWLLAFVTSDGPLGFTAYAGQGVALVPPMVGNGLAVVSVIVLVYALLSLGRNIGFIPTLRKIVTRGACRHICGKSAGAGCPALLKRVSNDIPGFSVRPRPPDFMPQFRPTFDATALVKRTFKLAAQ